jgi:hypothetical protein
MSATVHTEKQMDLAAAIRTSLRAFVWGMFSIIPIIGLVPGVYVHSCWRRVRTEYGNEWNPAAPYLLVGIALAAIGFICSLCVVLGIICKIALS